MGLYLPLTTLKSYLDVANNCKLPILKCGFKEGFENEYMDFYNDKILN